MADASPKRIRARTGLVSADHSKRGRRLVTVLEPETYRVSILEPWEHAILVLCDGSRSAADIAKLLEQGVDGIPVAEPTVDRAIRWFERHGLTETTPTRVPSKPGVRTLAKLQAAYQEWHKNPEITRQILTGQHEAPFIDGPALDDLNDVEEPQSLVANSVLDGVSEKAAELSSDEARAAVRALLDAVDDDFLEPEGSAPKYRESIGKGDDRWKETTRHVQTLDDDKT